MLTETHAQQAWTERKPVRRSRDIRTASQAVSLAVRTVLSERGETPVAVNEFYRAYERLGSKPGVDRDTRTAFGTTRSRWTAQPTDGGQRRVAGFSLDIAAEVAVAGLQHSRDPERSLDARP